MSIFHYLRHLHFSLDQQTDIDAFLIRNEGVENLQDKLKLIIL